MIQATVLHFATQFRNIFDELKYRCVRFSKAFSSGKKFLIFYFDVLF